MIRHGQPGRLALRVTSLQMEKAIIAVANSNETSVTQAKPSGRLFRKRVRRLPSPCTWRARMTSSRNRGSCSPRSPFVTLTLVAAVGGTGAAVFPNGLRRRRVLNLLIDSVGGCIEQQKPYQRGTGITP